VIVDLNRDIIYSNHCGYGHYLAYILDVKGLIAEILGLSSDVCHSIDGSRHSQFKNFSNNGIQGAGTNFGRDNVGDKI
jgi:acetoin:2,6-dichlorophenolindophenol oxidoreductase subunit alpha